MLSAIAIVLGLTLSPCSLAEATIMHITVIGGNLKVYCWHVCWIYFRFISFTTTAAPLLKYPIIAIIPRILIGLFSYYAYKWTKNTIISAIVGGLTNTVGVLGLGVAFKIIPFAAAVGIAGTQGIPEAIVGAIITMIVVKALYKVLGEKA